MEDCYQRVRAGSLGTKPLARRVQGRGFYHNVTSGADFAAQPSCVEIIAPVVRGLEIDEDSTDMGRVCSHAQQKRWLEVCTA